LAASDLHAAVAPEQTHSWHPLDLSTIEQTPAVRPTMYEGLLYPGMRHLISGEPESGKSWIMACACVAEIRAGRNVAWVDLESDPRFMAERLRCLGLVTEELGHFVYMQPSEAVSARVMRTIAAILDQYEPTIVVFDAFAGLLDLHDLDGNRSADVERGYRRIIEPWRANGAATSVIDHVTKNRETRGRFSTGSERKLGGIDVHIGLEQITPFGRGREGKAKVIVHKDRIGFLRRPRFGDFVMEADEEGFVRRALLQESSSDEGHWQPTGYMQRVSEWLALKPEPVSQRQIIKGVSGRQQYIIEALDELVDAGFVLKDDAGFSFVRAYEEPKGEEKPWVADETPDPMDLFKTPEEEAAEADAGELPF
jgi:hypothetical protein